MKAISYSKYGTPEVLKLVQLDKPVPKSNEVLIEIHATTVTSGDARLRASDFPPLFWLPARLIFGLFTPIKKVLGHEYAGKVIGIGEEVKKFKIGDEVFGTATFLKAGSYAEYITVPLEWKHGVLDFKPKGLSFDQAAAIPIGGMTALFLLKKAKLAKVQKVLIYGASGSVGSYGVQIAKAYGAHVTAMCSSSNLEIVASLGADEVIDYTTEDYASLNGQYDIVFDAVGKVSKSKSKGILQPEGQYISVNMMTKERREDLLELKELAEKGQIKALIDKVMPLDEIVKAHAYVDSGRKKGNLIIKVAD